MLPTKRTRWEDIDIETFLPLEDELEMSVEGGSEVWFHYIAARVHRIGVAIRERILDPIPPDIVAAIIIKRCGRRLGLYLETAAGYQGNLEIVFLRVPLGFLAGKVQLGEIEPQNRRPQPHVHRGKCAWAQAQLPELAGTIRLLRITDEHIRAWCAIFGVPKKDIYARLIFDARLANWMLQRLPGFRLFRLHQLHEAIARWGGERVLLLDFRHHFYQIPLPADIATYFGIEGAPGSLPPRFNYVPVAMPMGFHSAPCCGQAVTWATVLARSQNAPSLGVPSQVYRQQEMPEYVSLREGDCVAGREIGRIFVLMDGVAIFADSLPLLEAWSTRLSNNCERYHVIIKDPDDPLGHGSPQIVSTQSEKGATFAGINWNHEGLKPDAELGDISALKSLKQVAATVGRLMWAIRARGGNLLDHEPLLDIAHATGVAAHRGGQDYSRDARLSAEQNEYLANLTQHLRRLGRVPARVREVPQTKFFAATDATPTRRAFVIYESEHKLKAVIASPLLPPGPQGLREIEAVLDLCLYIQHETGHESFHLTAAIDNEAVRAAIEQQSSTSPAFRRVLRNLREIPCVITTRRVSSKQNLADEPSRGLPVNLVRLKETWNILSDISLPL